MYLQMINFREIINQLSGINMLKCVVQNRLSNYNVTHRYIFKMSSITIRILMFASIYDTSCQADIIKMQN